MTRVKPFLKQVNVHNTEAMTKDGEIYTAQKKLQIVEDRDDKFMMSYCHLIGFINGLSSIVDVHVLNWIHDNLQYNDNTIALNKFYKQKIQEYTKHSYSAIERSIGVLVDKGYLTKDDTCKRCAIYHVNPTYVFYGDRDKRQGKLKFVLELIQYNNLPDKEREIHDDIKRYAEYVKK